MFLMLWTERFMAGSLVRAVLALDLRTCSVRNAVGNLQCFTAARGTCDRSIRACLDRGRNLAL